jgi:lipopolysaccharide export LptBFGC system permease protein LptF
MTSLATNQFHAQIDGRIAAKRRWYRPSYILVKYTLGGYLQRVTVTYCCILTVALGIDFAGSLQQVIEAGPEHDTVSVLKRIGYYIGLRVPDISAHLLGIATFLGVLWWEMVQSKTGQRVAAWNGGQSPARGLLAAVALGFILGAVQMTLDTWLRPAVVEAQMFNGLGKLGQRYDRRQSHNVTWAAAGDDILSARIQYGERAVLRDLSLFRLSEEGRLHQIVQATTATQTSRPGYWHIDGAVWSDVVDEAVELSGRESLLREQAAEGPLTTERSNNELLYLDFDPNLFKFQHVDAVYLSPEVMRALIERGEPKYLLDDYQARLYYRYAHAMYPGLMAALAATVATFAVGKLTPIVIYVGIVLSGYFGHVLVKIGVSLGELGYVPPLFAAWLGVLIIALTVALLQFRVALRSLGG